MKREKHAELDNFEHAMQYYDVTGKPLNPLPPELKLGEFYTPSQNKQNRDYIC